MRYKIVFVSIIFGAALAVAQVNSGNMQQSAQALNNVNVNNNNEPALNDKAGMAINNSMPQAQALINEINTPPNAKPNTTSLLNIDGNALQTGNLPVLNAENDEIAFKRPTALLPQELSPVASNNIITEQNLQADNATPVNLITAEIGANQLIPHAASPPPELLVGAIPKIDEANGNFRVDFGNHNGNLLNG